MAKLPTVRRIVKEDLQRFGDIPEWIDGLLQPLNSFLDFTSIALRNKLTFADNFASTVVQIDLTHNTFKEVSPRSNSRVIGILPIWAESGETIASYGFEALTNGNINLKVTFGSGSGTKQVRVVILLEG